MTIKSRIGNAYIRHGMIEFDFLGELGVSESQNLSWPETNFTKFDQQDIFGHSLFRFTSHQ